MKRLLYVMLIVAAARLTAGAADQPAQPEASKADTNGVPKIQFDKMVYDFGTTSLVQQLTGTFIVSNVGQAPLTIGKPTTSCGCTVAGLKTDKLAPGEKTELGFTMSVGNIPRGHAEKAINVPSNDPSLGMAKLTVKADSVPVFEYTPQVFLVSLVENCSNTKTKLNFSTKYSQLFFTFTLKRNFYPPSELYVHGCSYKHCPKNNTNPNQTWMRLAKEYYTLHSTV